MRVGEKEVSEQAAIVARYADQWNTWGLPDLVAQKSGVLDRRCEEVGRDPDEIQRL